MMRPAAAALCLVLVTSCALAKRHPRATTVSITTVVFSAGIGLPMSSDCSNTTSTCSGGYMLSMFGLGAAVGFGIGLLAVHELAPEAEAEPRPAPPRRPRPVEDEPVIVIVAPSVPDGPAAPDPSRTVSRGTSSGSSPWTATGHAATPLRACAEAKREVFRNLEDECAARVLPGVATTDVAERDCDCDVAASQVACSIRASLTCARLDTDVIGLAASASSSRSVAEATAAKLAAARCAIAGLDAGEPTTTCRCDDAECACIAETDCQARKP